MINEDIKPPYPQKLKIFLSLAERDHLDEKASEEAEYKEGLPKKTRNILVKEIHKRLRMIEESFKNLELDIDSAFTDSCLPKVPLHLPVEVLDIFLKSIKKFKRDGIHIISDLYREKLTGTSLSDTYYVNRYLQRFLNKSLEQIGLPTLYKEPPHVSAMLRRLIESDWKSQFSPDEADDHKVFTLPDILIYRFHDEAYRSLLDGKEVHILETVVWGNMRPDDAAKAIGIPGVGFLPHIIRSAGRKLIAD